MAGTVGFAVLGAGGIAGSHLKAMAEIAEARVVAVADIDPARAQARLEEFGGERWFDNWPAALECPGVDAVIVCLPHALHTEPVVAAARAGKHILVEKPMATTLADCTAMVDAAAESGVVLMVGQVLRFREANLAARRLIREGRIGRPHHVIRRRLGWFRDWVPWSKDPKLCGGISLYGFGSHELDQILWLTDTQATRVYAEGRKVNPVWRDYDDVSVQMRLSDGSVAALHLSCNSKQRAWDCVVMGDEGTLCVDGDALSVDGESVPVAGTAGGGMEAQLREFLGAIREGREPEASGRQVRDTTMAALEAARISLDSHQVVDAQGLLSRLRD